MVKLSNLLLKNKKNLGVNNKEIYKIAIIGHFIKELMIEFIFTTNKGNGKIYILFERINRAPQNYLIEIFD